jgi:uncharacterized membrane protein
VFWSAAFRRNSSPNRRRLKGGTPNLKMMNPTISEWTNLLARWFHVFAGILWIGTTYFFTWLDGRFTDQEGSKPGTKTQVWMVHSGGFYVVEKEKQPGPHELHWFRYEALFTWLSGMVLMFVVYYLGGALIDRDVWDISPAKAAAIGIGVLIVGWIVYDLMAQSPLVKNEIMFAIVSYMLLVAASFGLTRVFSGRAAYMHVGAMMGTIMAANVWMRILPAQRKMIAAVKEGKEPDQNLALRAKLRSKHNTFMIVPVVFIMISNHFPAATYGDRNNWIILAVLILVGWFAAKIIRRA